MGRTRFPHLSAVGRCDGNPLPLSPTRSDSEIGIGDVKDRVIDFIFDSHPAVIRWCVRDDPVVRVRPVDTVGDSNPGRTAVRGVGNLNCIYPGTGIPGDRVARVRLPHLPTVGGGEGDPLFLLRGVASRGERDIPDPFILPVDHVGILTTTERIRGCSILVVDLYGFPARSVVVSVLILPDNVDCVAVIDCNNRIFTGSEQYRIRPARSRFFDVRGRRSLRKRNIRIICRIKSYMRIFTGPGSRVGSVLDATPRATCPLPVHHLVAVAGATPLSPHDVEFIAGIQGKVRAFRRPRPFRYFGPAPPASILPDFMPDSPHTRGTNLFSPDDMARTV